MTVGPSLEDVVRRADDRVASACSVPLRALRWLVDGRHPRFGARLTQLSFAGGSVVGAYFTDDNLYLYVGLCTLVGACWALITEAELYTIEAAAPDLLVQPVFPVVVFRLTLVLNLVAGLVLVAGGAGTYPAWSYSLNVGAIAGSYLMYLPESPHGRRSFVAGLVGRLAHRSGVAPAAAGMA